MITKIVSGGQTGADQGALEACLHCEMPYAGWVPKGRKAENGIVPLRYEHLKEMESADYLKRTEANVVDSDATVIYTIGALSGGSLKTAEYAHKHKRPCLHVDMSALSRKDCTDTIVDWLLRKCPPNCVLNVAGSRESKSRGIQQKVMIYMVDVISKANGKLFYPLGEEG